MVTEVVPAEQTWRLLWSHIASQVISSLPPHDDYKTVYAGYGWGVMNTQNQRGLLIHPTGEGREIGDLSLMVRGEGSQIIPRCGADLMHYLDNVSDIVETVVRSYITD